MTKPYRARTFKSGNSVALRLPKGLGIDQGVEMVVREDCGKFIFEPVKEEGKFIDLTGIAGTMPWLKPMMREERGFDDPPRPWPLLDREDDA
ncbi:AbrB/MazE/SpoVT family DNA-binding domain-containing protein [Sphingomonas sp. M1A8_2b]